MFSRICRSSVTWSRRNAGNHAWSCISKNWMRRMREKMCTPECSPEFAETLGYFVLHGVAQLNSEIREPLRRGPTRVHRARQQIRQIAPLDAAVQELAHRSPQPGPGVAQRKPFLQQRLQAPRRAMGMPPNQVFGVVLRPVLLENSVLCVQLIPQLRLRMRRHDGDLRDVQLQRRQRAQILANGFRRLARETNDVVTLRIALRLVQPPRELQHRFDLFAFMNLLEHVLMEA